MVKRDMGGNSYTRTSYVTKYRPNSARCPVAGKVVEQLFWTCKPSVVAVVSNKSSTMGKMPIVTVCGSIFSVPVPQCLGTINTST